MSHGYVLTQLSTPRSWFLYLQDSESSGGFLVDHWPSVLTGIFDVCTYLISNWVLKDADSPTGLQAIIPSR